MTELDWVVIGSGLAGITAARGLISPGTSGPGHSRPGPSRRGHSRPGPSRPGLNGLVLDKGRGVGGRMASWAPRGTRDPAFQAVVKTWLAEKLVKAWFKRGALHPQHPHPQETCYCATAGMRAIIDELAKDIPVHQGIKVSSVQKVAEGWLINTEAGASYTCKGVVITAPMPQTLTLLAAGGISAESFPGLAPLEQTAYAPCHSVMALLDGPSGLPSPGVVCPQEGPVHIISDNRLKGMTAKYAITIQAKHDFAATHFEEDRKEVGRRLIEAAQPWLKADILEFHVQRWKFSAPTAFAPGPCFTDPQLPGLVLAGDVFSSARVEGAFLSGLAGGQALRAYLGGNS